MLPKRIARRQRWAKIYELVLKDRRQERISERIDEQFVDITVPQDVPCPQIMGEWVDYVPVPKIRKVKETFAKVVDLAQQLFPQLTKEGILDLAQERNPEHIREEPVEVPVSHITKKVLEGSWTFPGSFIRAHCEAESRGRDP